MHSAKLPIYPSDSITLLCPTAHVSYTKNVVFNVFIWSRWSGSVRSIYRITSMYEKEWNKISKKNYFSQLNREKYSFMYLLWNVFKLQKMLIGAFWFHCSKGRVSEKQIFRVEQSNCEKIAKIMMHEIYFTLGTYLSIFCGIRNQLMLIGNSFFNTLQYFS